MKAVASLAIFAANSCASSVEVGVETTSVRAGVTTTTGVEMTGCFVAIVGLGEAGVLLIAVAEDPHATRNRRALAANKI
jgi:hypothetical protein